MCVVLCKTTASELFKSAKCNMLLYVCGDAIANLYDGERLHVALNDVTLVCCRCVWVYK